MDIGGWATAYAAIVATVVGGVQVWQIMRSGPRLRISVAPNVDLIGGNDFDQNMICVSMTNIGTAPTTIEMLGVQAIPKRFKRLRKADRVTYVIANPQPAGDPRNLPKNLNPGEKWTGFIRISEERPNFRNGKFEVLVSSSMHAKDLRAKIPSGSD